MTDEKRFAPRVDGQLRHNILRMPETVYDATGIVINGRCIKSFVFTTDLAIIRNCDADAVFAVYPFTPQQAILSRHPTFRYSAVLAEERPTAFGPWVLQRMWNVRGRWALCSMRRSRI